MFLTIITAIPAKSAQMRLEILDLDGSLAAQTSLRDIAAWPTVDTINPHDPGLKVRL
jgi:hypothetical protein